MAHEIILQGGRDERALGNQLDRGRQEPGDHRGKERVMRAAEDDRVDPGIEGQEAVDVAADEEFRPGAVQLVVFDERHPERAGFGMDDQVREELHDLEGVGLGPDRSGGREQPDMPAPAERPDALRDRADDAEDPPAGMFGGKILLLDRSEGFGRGGVAGQDDQPAAPVEQPADRFPCEAMDGFERSRPVGRPGVVAQVDEIVLRKDGGDFPEDGQPAVSRIEDSDRPGDVHRNYPTPIPF